VRVPSPRPGAQDADAAQSAAAHQRLRQRRQQTRIGAILDDLRGLIAESREGVERVRQIVPYRKLISHGGEKRPIWAGLDAGIENTLIIVCSEIKYKATVEKDCGPLSPVLCYAQELDQVFTNLLVNAAQAIAGQEGRTLVRIRKEDG